MKRKTNFKQMYLIDATLYNKIDSVLPKPLLLDKSNTLVSNPILKLREVPTKIESENLRNPSAAHTTRSIGTITNDMKTSSRAVMTETPNHQTSGDQIAEVGTVEYHTPQPVRATLPYTVRMNDHPSQVQYRPSQDEFPIPRSQYRTPRLHYHNPPLADEYLSQYMEVDPSSAQFNAPLALSSALHPQSEAMDTALALTSETDGPLSLAAKNVQPQIMDYNTNIPIEYNAPLTLPPPPQSQITGYNMNKYNTPPAIRSRGHLVLSSAPQPQSKDQDINLALSPPVEADCEDCAVSEYKKYDLALPFARGLPDNVLFTCTLCNTNFNSQKALERHMKNLHDAFDQIEKGLKRKYRVKKKQNNSKKVKTTEEAPISYLNFM